jgi:DNA-binding transcriptional MerR regulator
MEYSIGHLSKISRVCGKKLHRYHMSGLVVPTRIDKFDSYFRYYGEKCLREVEIVTRFFNMGFSEEVIKKILPKNRDTKFLIQQMRSRLTKNDPLWEKLGLSRELIETFLQAESTQSVKIGELQIKDIPDVYIAYDRFYGKPAEIKEHQIKIQDICNQAADGSSFALFLDYNQLDEEMNMDCCIPIKSEFAHIGLESRTLTGMKAITIQYEGNPEKIWMGYKQIVDFYITNHMDVQFPSREVYLNGDEKSLPGANDHTRVEIQFIIGNKNEPDQHWVFPEKRF